MANPLRLALVVSLTLHLVGCTIAWPNSRAAAPDSEAESAATTRTAAWFEARRGSPGLLRSFIQRMPKGGDLHNHLSGAAYAESYLAWAAAEEYPNDYCIETKDLRLKKCRDVGAPRPSEPCDPSRPVIRMACVLNESGLYNRLVDLMSTRNLDFAGRSGHDQFFAAFGQFGPAAKLRLDDMVAEVASRAASQHTYYLELMLTLQSDAVRALSKRITFDRLDLPAARKQLIDSGLLELVAAGKQNLDALSGEVDRTMRCGQGDASPGCKVTVRYLQQTTRTNSPAEVFSQFVYAFELVRADSRLVGLNLVAPEDDRVALRDYTLQMEMLGFLASQNPEVNIALHAGELTLGMVPPKDLRFHIRQAIGVGRARRIGHGVSVFYEDDAVGLLAEMRKRDVAVEICLTSNDVILGIRGEQHPFKTYRAAKAPLTLATDDEGVSRIDLSNEFLRAALTYGLGYRDLKDLARNALHYSFLPGRSLWRRHDPFAVVEDCEGSSPGSSSPASTCAAFLTSSERAREQWRLEAELAAFEALGWNQ
jgi:adenosine deaminase/adenosine deaminase CECR1